jgi:hypothetical protein
MRSRAQICQPLLELILLGNLAKETREIGAFLRSDLGGGCIRRGSALCVCT